MRGMKIIGLAVALAASNAASAATFFATITGRVTEQFATPFTAPDATSPIQVGDTITATFRYQASDSVSTALAGRYGMFGMNKAVFTLGGFTWSSDGDMLDGAAPPVFTAGSDPLVDYVSIMDDAPGGGDLWVRRYEFEIGEFGYDLYEGPGFRGVFDRDSLVTAPDGAPEALAAISPVPELTMWAQMIAGFAVVGTAFRQRSARRARWRGIVARLSGRVPAAEPAA